MREQFTFYRSYFDAIRRLRKAADRAAIYDAIADYALYGNAPQLSDAAGAIFDLIRPTLDAAKRKSDGVKNKEAGKTAERKAQDDSGTSAECAEDSGKTRARYAQDTGKIPARYAEVEIEVEVEDTRKEKEEEKEKEKEYEKESYIKETRSNERVKKSAARFTAPTVEEVAEYCRGRGNCVDAERFCSFYASNGWKVGKNPMQDWKAAVRTWEKNGLDDRREKPSKAPQSFTVDEFFEKAMQKAYGGTQ